MMVSMNRRSSISGGGFAIFFFAAGVVDGKRRAFAVFAYCTSQSLRFLCVAVTLRSQLLQQPSPHPGQDEQTVAARLQTPPSHSKPATHRSRANQCYSTIIPIITNFGKITIINTYITITNSASFSSASNFDIITQISLCKRDSKKLLHNPRFATTRRRLFPFFPARHLRM